MSVGSFRWLPRGLSVAIVAACFVLQVPKVEGVTEMRVWHGTTGNTLQAKATTFADGVVTLLLADGRETKVPLARFVPEEQAILSKHFQTAGASAAATATTAAPAASPAASATQPATGLPHALGAKVGPITAAPGATYFVYLPKTLQEGRKYPVLYIMSPGGGSAGVLDRYIPGAELNRWVLAVSVESKNGGAMDANNNAVSKMAAHVASTLPIDPKRIYTSGFSGGARMSFMTGDKLSAAGIIPCGAGDGGGGKTWKPKATQVVYGLCGTNCFNRWDMSETFKKDVNNKDSILRFFPGGHDWAGAEPMKDAMTHLNGVYLAQNRTAHAAEAVQYERDVMDWIAQLKGTDPQRAYLWVDFLARRSPSVANLAALNQLNAELKSAPANLLYVQGLQEIDKLAQRRLSQYGSAGWTKGNANEEDTRAFVTLSKKLEGTPWMEICQKLSEKSVTP